MFDAECDHDQWKAHEWGHDGADQYDSPVGVRAEAGSHDWPGYGKVGEEDVVHGGLAESVSAAGLHNYASYDKADADKEDRTWFFKVSE